MKIVVVSLFDGMSCGRIALDRTPKLNVKRYYSSEIDKYAIQIADKNYPQDTKHRLGNVIDINGKSLGKKIRKKFGKKMKIILIGGSPCQGFSNAGKRKGSSTSCGIDVTSLEQYLTLKKEGFEFDGQSYLFWEYVRIWKELKPDLFFLENVRVTKKWLPMFNETMGVEPIFIDSQDVSAGLRKRYYWTNIPNITHPDIVDISLEDVLDGAWTEKKKSYCIDANYGKGSNLRRYLYRGSRQIVFTDKRYLIGLMMKKPDIDKCNLEGKMSRDKWRFLTPVECERIQTIPDNYTEGVPKFWRYHMVGNGWTVDVISWIFSHIIKS